MDLAVLKKPCATEGTSQRLPDVTGRDSIVEGCQDFVIEDHEICEGVRGDDPAETQTTAVSGTGENRASG
ncbi:MAG: hypothetical protein HY268_25040 [Deltaproteobacteria bacterium]|nr:hypothetical protein [Deltaproteobacteria bacterium]